MDDSFAKRIKAYRLSLGATQQEVAAIIGVDHTTYAHYETGRRTPDLEKLTRMARYFGLTDELLGVGDDHRFAEKRQLAKDKLNFYFPVVAECDGVDMKRVYPLKQQTVVNIHNYLIGEHSVRSVILFGSSISNKCHKDSDIDLMIRLADDISNSSDLYEIKGKISEHIMDLCEWNADILWYDRLSETDRVYQDILYGVRVA